LAHDVIVALAIVAAVVLAVVVGLRALGVKMRRMRVESAARRVIRVQHQGFVARLRELVFSDPFRYMNMLCSKESEWFVRGLWKEEGDKWARVRISGGPEGEMMSGDGTEPPHPERLSDEGMGVEQIRLNNGAVLAIVRLPPPKDLGETYLIGVVLPPDETLKVDIARARRLVRFFVVNRWEGERRTDLCQWKVDGKQLTYNVGSPLDANGFALAVQGKMEEERQRRGQKSTA